MHSLRRVSLFLLLLLPISHTVSAQSYAPDILELDGSNGLGIDPDEAFNINGYGTIEFWVTPDWTDDPGYDPTIISNVGVDGASLLIAMLRDRDGIGIVNGDEEYYVAFDFTDGQLHHVALNDYGDTFLVYIDLQLVGRFDTQLIPLPTSGLFIGTADGASYPFVGAIAGLRIWGVPVEPDDLRKFAMRDALEEGHPDVNYLNAMSDFANRNLIVYETE